jgi:hypothetical protein
MTIQRGETMINSMRGAARASATVVSTVLFLASCAASSNPPPASTASIAPPSHSAEATLSEPTTTPSPSVGNDLIGRWERDQTCLELVDTYNRVGLKSFIGSSLVGIGFVEGAVKDDGHPCRGAKVVHRSQVFSFDGSYAGLDPSGIPVDGGRWQIASPGMLEISDGEESTTFRYRVDRGLLTFEVIWPKPCRTFECQDHMSWATETFTLGPWAQTVQ